MPVLRRLLVLAALSIPTLASFGATVSTPPAVAPASATAPLTLTPSGWYLAAAPPGPMPRIKHALAYDSARRRVVLYGGSLASGLGSRDTWEWDGKYWIRALPFNTPSAETNMAMAYDEALGKTLLFGGQTFAPVNLAETWAWDGTEWNLLSPLMSPSPRSDHQLTYDESRGQVLLHGGSETPTWTWDGATWVNRTPANLPARRVNFGLAYDPPRGRILLFGGIDGYDYFNDTWQWNGLTALWTQLNPANSPKARFLHATAPTANGVLLYGGVTYDLALPRDTYEWDGATWNLKTPAHSPTATGRVEMAYDAARNVVVAFGGSQGGIFGTRENAETWEWNGVDWTDQTPPRNFPPYPAGKYRLAYAEPWRRTLAFSGLDPASLEGTGDVWDWDGTNWRVTRPKEAPGTSGPIVFDRDRNRLVLFGGPSNDPSPGKTWEWDGKDWSEEIPSVRPPSRRGHAMVFADNMHRVILVGGLNNQTGLYDDTWTWDGFRWTQLPTGLLTERHSHAMAYDAARQRVVLFGGCADFYCVHARADTWEFDGSTWLHLTPAVVPPARSGHAMAYDPIRSRVVMFGGAPDVGIDLTDTWEWDGMNWQLREAPQAPPGSAASATFDTHRNCMVLQTSNANFFVVDSATWEYPAPPACRSARRLEAFVPGSGAGAGAPLDALGAADGHAVSLGSDGTLTVRIASVADAPGWDLVVNELGSAAGDVDENFLVEFSEEEGEEFRRAAVCTGGPCGIDLNPTGLSSVTLVRIRDLAPAEPGVPAGFAGADIDSVEALHCKPEICDGRDNNGDGSIDEGCDQDGDGYCGLQVLGNPAVCPLGGRDCDDHDAAVYPGAPQLCDGINTDCDDLDWPLLPPAEADADADTCSACELDCDETNPKIYFGAPQLCDGINNDCADPSYPQVPRAEQDLDGDGYKPCAGDCDDTNPSISPVGTESCNGIDDDCDGVIDDGVSQFYYLDGDADGWGNASAPIRACSQPAGTIIVGGDCNDADPARHPGATETCNGLDDNCDGKVDEDAAGVDSDGDGVANSCDNCLLAVNPSQQDRDADRVGDLCDSCPAAANPGQEDPDLDLYGSACDNCPTVYNYQEDFEADGVGDACDNCAYQWNPSQANVDADAEGDACDFDDGLLLQFRTERDYIEWQPDSTYEAFNVYQGDLAVLRASGTYTQTPVANPLAERTCGVIEPYVEDFDTPPSGKVQFSLVTGMAGGIESSLGTNSAGATRPNVAPCP